MKHNETKAEAPNQRAVIYSRVSTIAQAEEGISLDAQLARARGWCQAMGYSIAGEFCDAGLSGKRADNRPGLQDALALACNERAALVVYSLSRLARSTKDAIAISDRLHKAGADFVSLSEQIDTTTAAGKMVFRMLAVLSEFERDLVSERTITALSHKKALGYKTGGTVPYGFDVDQNRLLVENRAEQEAIALIKALREKGYTLREISGELAECEIKTKTGGRWSPKVIRGILLRAA